MEIPITEIRHLKIKVQSFGTIPIDDVGAGNSSWFFIDEIVVN
jgi:hypothetical protein